jgi:hypothetical protein
MSVQSWCGVDCGECDVCRLQVRAQGMETALRRIAYEIDTQEPPGYFPDESAISPPIGLTDEEAWTFMCHIAREALSSVEAKASP